MDDQTRAASPAHRLPSERIPGLDALAELALDLRWSWNHAGDHLWRQLDPALWELTHNPWVVLQTTAAPRLEAALADAGFRGELDRLLRDRRQASDTPAWFQQAHPGADLAWVAYFSMEFMLSEALPIYSGGLGNVAGDQLKAASDLGVPVVGVGLLYQQGYFRQAIDRDGNQQALYPYNDPGQMPVTPVRQPDGQWLRLEVKLPGYSMWLRAWQVQVGRCVLYLLDSNDPANQPAHRGITSELYGGGPELRLQQELVLGIGGWRLLRAIGLRPQVCHLNEGHAAFAVLERARAFMDESGQPFEVALAATRPGNLFTTHTAVPAGFDRFPPALIEQYLTRYAGLLGLSMHDLLALGRANPDDAGEPFNMAYLALHGSGAVNGVSRLHGQVSRELFGSLFPRWPRDEVPVGHVTNGVHVPTWDSAPADDLWTRACGCDRWLGTNVTLAETINRASDADLWRVRGAARKDLVAYVRGRRAQDLAAAGAVTADAGAADQLFNPDALTLGFARRFASYKRPNLLLHDPDRLLRLLTNPSRPVQLFLAGKAHPADGQGQALIHQWMQFLRRPEARPHVVFLADYDMLLAERLVQGVDVWVNTPRRPWEASGTSGMKVLVNGGLNVSELDGWWAEAYAPEVGWALGDGREHGDDPAWDAAEADRLYELLEREVVPAFYDRGPSGIPSGWVARVRASMSRLTPAFSADRAVREYTERYYLPAAAAVTARTADRGGAAAQVVRWQHAVRDRWPRLRFGPVHVTTADGFHRFDADVDLGEMDPAWVRVEIVADAASDAPAVRREAATTDGRAFSVAVPATRPASDFTLRAMPRHPGVAVPLEAAQVAWQR